MAHTSDVFEFLEGTIDDLNAAVEPSYNPAKAGTKSESGRRIFTAHARRLRSSPDTREVCEGTSRARQSKVPLDHRVRETTTMPKRETNLVPESHIRDGHKSLFHETFTTSVNQCEEKLLGGKTKMLKVRPVMAGIHWLQFRRPPGTPNPQTPVAPHVAVVDVLAEDGVARAFKHFETERNLDGNRFAVGTIEMYARMWSAMGKVFLDNDVQELSSTMVSHSSKEQGDVERESDDANKTIDKVRPTFQDIVHKRMVFVKGTEKMEALQTSPSWPPAE